MAPTGTRTITIRFDGSAKGLVAEAVLASRAISSVGSNVSGLKKAEKEADNLSSQLRKTATDAKESGSLLGASMALGLSAAAPLVGAALIGGVSLGFVGVAALVQKNNKQVKDSFSDLKSQVVGEMQDASDQVVPYLVKAGHSLQQEFANLGPQIDEAFRFAGPDIDILTSGVDKLADNAMPGLVTSMRNSKPIVQGVSTVLGDLGTTATTVLDDVSAHSQEFGNDLDQVGELITNVGSVAGAVLPGLASGFGTTVGSVNALLGILKPVAPELGNITGEVLPAVGAFKLFGLATAPLNTLGSKVAGVAGNLGGFTSRLTGSEAAGAKVTNTTAKFGSALGRVGGVLPLVGVGLGLMGDAMSAADNQQKQLLQDLVAGGEAGRKAAADIASSAPTIAHLATGFQQGEGSARQFNDALNVATQGMDPLEKATAIYNADLDHFGAKSSITIAAQHNLAAANDRSQQAQQRLNQALISTNERLSQQETLLLSSVDANLSYQSAVLGVKQAQTDYASAVKNSGAKSLEARQALVGLQQAQAGAAEAAVKAADANNTNSSASQRAKAESDAYASAVLGMAAASNGHLTPALARMVDGLKATQISAFAATGKVNGTHQAIVKINGKSVRINVDGTGKAVANAHAVRDAIAGVKSKSVFLNTYIDTIVRGPGAKSIGSAPGIGGLLDLGHRASGGPVRAGMPYIVGENAPELFVPDTNGRILNGDQTADALSGWSGDIVIPIDLGDGIQQVIRLSNRELKQRVRAGAGAR